MSLRRGPEDLAEVGLGIAARVAISVGFVEKSDAEIERLVDDRAASPRNRCARQNCCSRARPPKPAAPISPDCVLPPITPSRRFAATRFTPTLQGFRQRGKGSRACWRGTGGSGRWRLQSSRICRKIAGSLQTPRADAGTREFAYGPEAAGRRGVPPVVSAAAVALCRAVLGVELQPRRARNGAASRSSTGISCCGSRSAPC